MSIVPIVGIDYFCVMILKAIELGKVEIKDREQVSKEVPLLTTRCPTVEQR